MTLEECLKRSAREDKGIASCDVEELPPNNTVITFILADHGPAKFSVVGNIVTLLREEEVDEEEFPYGDSEGGEA